MTRELIDEMISELEAMERLVRRRFPEFVHPLIAKLRAAPPAAQRQPLTDEQIMECVKRIDRDQSYLPKALKQLARAVEAAHGIGSKT